MRRLWQALCLPALPMHYTAFAKLGGVHVEGQAIVEQGIVTAVSESIVDGILQRTIQDPNGVQKALERGAQLPLTGDLAELAKAIKARPELQMVAETKGKVWRSQLARLKKGEHLVHMERFKLMMSMLRAGWSDPEIQEAFSHSPDYKPDVTQAAIDHARNKYL